MIELAIIAVMATAILGTDPAPVAAPVAVGPIQVEAVEPATACPAQGADGIIVQGGKAPATSIIVQGGKSRTTLIIVQGGKAPATPIIVQGGIEASPAGDLGPQATATAGKCGKAKL